MTRPDARVIRVKICGITTAEDARAAADAGADAVGCVLAPSKRQVTLDRAREIVGVLPPFVARVAVLVDPSESEAREIASSGLFTHLQLHGNESPCFVAALGLPAVKAVRLCEAKDLADLEAFAEAAPEVSILVDGPAGGSGRVCDWNLARIAASCRPLVLAGGLTPENVAEAIRAVAPAAVDVSGGVELAPGRKDPARVQAFVRAVRECHLPPPTAAPGRVRVADISELTPGRGKLVRAGTLELALHNVDGTLYATEAACPHRGGPMADAFQMGKNIVCPWHGWQFDVETGRSTLVPNVSIRTYRVTVDGSDVYVELGTSSQ